MKNNANGAYLFLEGTTKRFRFVVPDFLPWHGVF